MAASEQVLKDISNSVARVIESTNQFKTAVNENNKNIARIVKDIASTFNLEKAEMDHLDSSIASNSSQITQTNARINHTNSILAQSVALQTALIQETKALRAEIVQLSGFVQKNGEGGLGSVIANSISFIWNKTKKGMLAGAAAVGIVGGGMLGSENVRDSVMGAFGLGGSKSKEGGDATPSRQGAPGKGLASNQAEAYKAARAEGLSDRAAKLLVANMTGESLSKPNDHHWDVHHMSQGIVQWDPSRAEAIKKQFGKYPKDMTVEEQTKAAIWEMKNNKAYSKTWEALKNEKLSDAEIMRIIVENYERPADPDKAVRQRLGHHEHIKDKNYDEPEKNDKRSDNSDSTERKLEAHVNKLFTLGGGVTGNEHNLKGIKPELQDALIGALKEYKERTGKTAKITSGHRTSEEQARVGATYGIKARPGHSQHEKGNAVDISEEDARAMEQMGILKKYGLHRPLGERDPVHIQMMPGYEKSPEQIERDNLEAAERRKKARDRDVGPPLPGEAPQPSPAGPRSDIPKPEYKESVIKAFGDDRVSSTNITPPVQPKSTVGPPILTGEATKSQINAPLNPGYIPPKTEIAALELNKDKPDLGAELNNRQVQKEANALFQSEEQTKAAKKRLIDGENQTAPTTDPITGYGSGEAGNTNDKNVLPDDGWPQLLISKYA